MVQERQTLVLPDFLDVDEEEIHDRMLGQAPENYDVSEGSLFWDVTRPAVLEILEMTDYMLPLMITSMFPQFAEGYLLDYHGEREGVLRREATYATGKITVEAVEETFIPAGTTVTTNEIEGVTFEYRTIDDETVSSSGSVSIDIEALEAGASSNVPSDSIVNFLEPITGVQALNNPSSISGGNDEEDDDTYRERIMQTNRTRSSTGNRADYVRWAKEIAGVGEVFVVPEWDGPGTVKVSIASSSGAVPSQDIIDEVQSYIAPDDRDGGGMAPIGARVTVTSINSRLINVTFSVTLEDSYDIDDVVKSIKDKIVSYLSEELKQGDLIRQTKVGAVIATTNGVIDYADLKINGKTGNLQLEPDEAAVIGEVIAE